jgi:hypothetical protein
MKEIPEVFPEIIQGRALSPVIGILLQVSEPGSIFFPDNDLDRLHRMAPQRVATGHISYFIFAVSSINGQA